MDLVKRLRSPEFADVAEKYLMVEAAAEIERLRAALESEWELVHHEHCGKTDCVSLGGAGLCHHSKPAALRLGRE